MTNGDPDAPASPFASPFAVLAWAVDVGAALALRDPPDGPPGQGAAGLALLAPRVLGVPRPLAVPAPVRATLAADWRVLRVLLADTHAALGRHAFPGWPASLDGPSGAAVLTVCTWAACVRRTLEDAERAAWAARARDAARTGAPRWLAAVAAVEGLTGPASACPAVRARHRAAVRAATGAADGRTAVVTAAVAHP